LVPGLLVRELDDEWKEVVEFKIFPEIKIIAMTYDSPGKRKIGKEYI
jgi:hypothetical protein